ncbi:MAG: hypothetical protein H6733_12005 [Alphaproteobacteria bacterium]|nr:hypothetical protein [Alphaproteobacteria bacterium]
MAMQFLRRAQQLKILDAADETAAILRSPAFARFRPAMEAVRFDVDAFADELAAKAAEGRVAYTERASAQDTYEGEASDVRAIVAAFEEWLRKLHAAARAIQMLDHPMATKIDKALKLDSFDGGSAENIHGNGPNLIRNLDKLGDLSELGIPAAFVEEGRKLLARMPPERSEVADSGFGRQVFTGDLHADLDAIVTLMERYERFREFANAMSGIEIPPLGLAAVRANLSGRPSSADLGADDADVDAGEDAAASLL